MPSGERQCRENLNSSTQKGIAQSERTKRAGRPGRGVGAAATAPGGPVALSPGWIAGTSKQIKSSSQGGTGPGRGKGGPVPRPQATPPRSTAPPGLGSCPPGLRHEGGEGNCQLKLSFIRHPDQWVEFYDGLSGMNGSLWSSAMAGHTPSRTRLHSMPVRVITKKIKNKTR
jgi:hypothetical protein